MGKFDKGSKPTRAEIKAQKRAAKEAAKQAEIDLRLAAKEAKRTARKERSWFGRKKDTDEDGRDPASDLGINASGSVVPGRPKHQENRSVAKAPRGEQPQEIIIDDDIKIIPAQNQGQSRTPRPGTSRLQSQSPASGASLGRVQNHGDAQNNMLFDISTPEGRAAAKKALEQDWGDEDAQSAIAPLQPDPINEGTFIRRKKPASPIDRSDQKGTEIRPARGVLPAGSRQETKPGGADPLIPHGERKAEPKGTPKARVTESFAALRKAVGNKAESEDIQGDDNRRGQGGERHIEPLSKDRHPSKTDPLVNNLVRNKSGEPKDVLELDDPITMAPAPTSPIPTPLMEDLAEEGDEGTVHLGISENWLGLWVSEDGEAIFIEDEDDGWFAITVLQDPTTKCYYGPDYPEIQTFRMPGLYAQEEIGDFVGERFSVITVPGLPDDHRSPIMYLYFLASVPASEGGGNRFATSADTTNRIFLVADFELGTVNPWSDEDDIEWIDPSVNYYKAPGKLDAYMRRRMDSEDPLNQF
jgi:hypothetical protein